MQWESQDLPLHGDSSASVRALASWVFFLIRATLDGSFQL